MLKEMIIRAYIHKNPFIIIPEHEVNYVWDNKENVPVYHGIKEKIKDEFPPYFGDGEPIYCGEGDNIKVDFGNPPKRKILYCCLISC